MIYLFDSVKYIFFLKIVIFFIFVKLKVLNVGKCFILDIGKILNYVI